MGANDPNPYTATIDWGDGSTTAGTISYDTTNDTFDVSGNHTYAEAGFYPVATTIVHDTAPGVTVDTSADIEDAPISLVAQGTGGVAGVSPATLTALLSDANPDATAGDYTATITWGDGSTTSASVAR